MIWDLSKNIEISYLTEWSHLTDIKNLVRSGHQLNKSLSNKKYEEISSNKDC